MESTTRLRPHPIGRFSPSQQMFDLKKSLEVLRGEAHEGAHGHRQMTIFHHAPVAMVLFSFEANGELADHAANGLVSIQALEGRLTVSAEEQTHELESGMMVVLQANVRHSVRAATASAMLLTVCLQKVEQSAAAAA